MEQLFLSIITGIFIGGVAGYLGTLMLSRRMALAAGPLSHLTLPGIALALIYGFDVSLGAFPFVILGIFFIWILEIKTKLPMEALTAVTFASGVAVAFLFLPIEQAETALVGDITKVNFIETMLTIALSLAIFFLIKKVYSKLILINISEDMARAEDIDIEKNNFFYLLSIAVVVALGVKMVGGLLTAALVAIPICAARNIGKNLSEYIYFSVFFGSFSAFSGILLFYFTRLPAGPLIIISGTVIFLLSVFFKRNV